MSGHVNEGNDGAYLPDLTSDLPVVWVMRQGERYFLRDGIAEDLEDDDLSLQDGIKEIIDNIIRKRRSKQGGWT
jgi:hypothetical protein